MIRSMYVSYGLKVLEVEWCYFHSVEMPRINLMDVTHLHDTQRHGPCIPVTSAALPRSLPRGDPVRSALRLGSRAGSPLCGLGARARAWRSWRCAGARAARQGPRTQRAATWRGLRAHVSERPANLRRGPCNRAVGVPHLTTTSPLAHSTSSAGRAVLALAEASPRGSP
jgi:hypothetical protein